MTVTAGGRTYRDGSDLAPGELYRMLSLGEVATTAAPSPQAFCDGLAEAARVADAALCITVSRAYSSSFESAEAAARRAREEMPGMEVSTLDSGTAAGGEGLVALAALRAAAAGGALAEVAAAASAAARAVRLVAYVDTTLYLWRGGRIPGIAHAGTSLLSVRPVFEVTRGAIGRRVPARSARSARSRLVRMVASAAGGLGTTACVMHAAAPDAADRALAELGDAADCREAYVTEFSAVMGAHIGPGALGIAHAPAELIGPAA